ncbi:F-box family protein [Striga asiatica]|uniref:F-box family protein n=1 Tax=Striga asiatica TaxID=4170 RepID=A0A5A7PDY1_STRAF|nr:F-box family protein [Striga asiatica]
MRGGDEELDIDRLPVDLLAHIFSLFTSFKDLAQASSVCKKWRQGVRESLARRGSLSFSGWKMDDESTTRLVHLAYSLKELDISDKTEDALLGSNGLRPFLFLFVQINILFSRLQISRATSLQHLNIGGTFITDASLFAIADSCPHLKTIVLWGCRHVTENGLLALVNKCRELRSINVWGMRVPLDCFTGLLTISPALQIQPKGMLLNDERVHIWPVY